MVRAYVADRPQLAPNIEHSNRSTADVHYPARARRELFDRADDMATGSLIYH